MEINFYKGLVITVAVTFFLASVFNLVKAYWL